MEIIEIKVDDVLDCKYLYDDICVNHDCPYRAEWCECTEHPDVCKFYEPVDLPEKRAE